MGFDWDGHKVAERRGDLRTGKNLIALHWVISEERHSKLVDVMNLGAYDWNGIFVGMYRSGLLEDILFWAFFFFFPENLEIYIFFDKKNLEIMITNDNDKTLFDVLSTITNKTDNIFLLRINVSFTGLVSYFLYSQPNWFGLNYIDYCLYKHFSR